MNLSLDQLKAAVCELPVSERAELAHFLLDSLEPDDAGIRAEWLDLAARRMVEVRAGDVLGVSAEEVLRSLAGRGQKEETAMSSTYPIP